MTTCLAGPIMDCCEQNSIEGYDTPKCLQVNTNYILDDLN